MILPVYASLERMDGSLIEAGRDLYGSSLEHLPHRHRAGHPGRRVRRPGAGLPAGDGRLHQRPAARRAGQPDDRQPDPGQVLRRPELAARRRADHGADGAAADLHVRLRAPDRARLREAPDDGTRLREPPAPMRGRPAAAARRHAARRGSGMDRKPKVAVAVTVLFFVLLYLPIVAVVLFSFNKKKSLTVFDGWSLQWYERVLERQRADPLARHQPPGRRGRDGRLGRHRHRCSRSGWCGPAPGSAARPT